MSQKRIVILGGGFAGVGVASRLRKRLDSETASIRLVNAENYFVYKPLLPEVVSGSVGLTDAVLPIRRLCPGTQFVMRETTGIDLARRSVTVGRGFDAAELEIPYDALVVALGREAHFSAIPGLQEHGLPFGDLADAILVRNRVIRCLAEAEIERDAEAKKKLLTFVVAGGGFSGVEAAAAINDFARDAIRSFSDMLPSAIRVVLVQAGRRILPEVGPSLAEFARERLRKRGVSVVLNDRLSAVSSQKATFQSGLETPTRCVVSTVPSAIPAVLRRLDCAKKEGGLETTPRLELRGHEGTVWALGDCAWIGLPNGDRAPLTAQHATRQAECVAHNVAASIEGKQAKVFDFGGLGKMGSLGHHAAVAEVMGFKLSGFVAWVLWRMFYLLHMPGWDRKLSIGLTWVTELFLPADPVQMRLRSGPGVFRQHLDTGESAFEEGDIGDSVYVVIAGKCEVVERRGEGEKRLAVLEPEDVFGEMAVLADVRRNATVRAVEPSDVLVISKPVFTALSSNLEMFREHFGAIAASRREARAAAQGESDERAKTPQS